MPTPGKTSFERTSDDSGLLTVWVPYDATVTINGIKTKSTGSRRQFVSYGLKPGYAYSYEITAEIAQERPWTATTDYVAGQVVRSAQGNFYKCTVAGKSGTTGPNENWVGEGFRDGSVTWQNLGPNYRGPGYRGMAVTASQTVGLKAGGREGVSFGFNTPTVAPETSTASNP